MSDSFDALHESIQDKVDAKSANPANRHQLIEASEVNDTFAYHLIEWTGKAVKKGLKKLQKRHADVKPEPRTLVYKGTRYDLVLKPTNVEARQSNSFKFAAVKSNDMTEVYEKTKQYSSGNAVIDKVASDFAEFIESNIIEG